MSLLTVLLQVIAVVAVGHLLSLLFVVELPRYGKRATDRGGWRQRVRSNLTAVAPSLGALAVVLAVNKVIRDVGVELSWLIGIRLTGYIYALESTFVAAVQRFATPELTAYFGFVYVFGYTYLLTFPILAYALYEEPRPLGVLFRAYLINYAVSIPCYVLFVAYGPRNFMPELVEPLLYVSWPQSQLLVQQVNTNTNVFPSLHASLSTTVALVAVRFRSAYPRWTPIAIVLAASIVVSTMYLGIHWATDVVAGFVLAAASVALADRFDDGRFLGQLRRWWTGRRGTAPE